jgi:hypothetical protein
MPNLNIENAELKTEKGFAMYFCHDVDLMIWEPGIFVEVAFSHQALFADVAATLTGTALVPGSSVLGHALPGMVARIDLADDSLTQLLEVVSVADGTHAVVSALRGRAGEEAVTPLVGGSVKASMVTFRPQIAAVGDELLGILGVMSDRDAQVDAATADLRGFRMAAIFGTLAAVFRTLSTSETATAATLAKREFYERLALQAKRAISGRADRDGDGILERRSESAVGEMVLV